MSDGQWRVFVLLLLLLAMEAIRHPAVGSVLTTLLVNPLRKASGG